MKKTKNKINTNFKLNILSEARAKGEITKSELSKELGINITTVTKLVNDLVNKYKILVEKGKAISSGGRKAKKFKIDETFGYILGVDIGGANIRFIITDIMGNLVSELISKKNEIQNYNKTIQEIIEGIDIVIKKSKIPKEKILGLGMGISGIIDTVSGNVLFCPNIKEFRDLPIQKIMEKELGLPVVIDDSVRCMAIAEKKYGIARNNNNFIFVSLGKGIGAGIFKDGQIYRGSLGLAGELGHITVSENGPTCNCGNKGCLEAIASSTGIIKRAINGIEDGIITSITSKVNDKLSDISIEIISKAAEEDDKFAYYLIERTGEYIGLAIAAALNLFGSRLVVIGGGVSEIGDILINSIKRTVKIRALEIISKKVKIERSKLGEASAALGAATICIDSIFSKVILNLFRQIDN